MKMKLTHVLTGLLLSVGWLNVSAQLLPTAMSFLPQTDFTGSDIRISQGARAPQREDAAHRPMVSLTLDEAKALKYKWWSSEKNDSVESNASEVASDPEQIYELLKFVYTDPRFPGPYTNAYTSTGVREDPVYYGGVERGWDIPFKEGSGYFQVRGDLVIGLPSGGYTYLREITIYNETGTRLTGWSGNNSSLPNGWILQNAGIFNSNNMTITSTNGFGRFSGAGTITIPASLLGNTENVRIVVSGYNTYSATADPKDKGPYACINVEGIPYDLTGYTASNYRTCETIVNRKQWVHTGAVRPTDVLITDNQGYSDVYFKSIKITDENGNTIYDWTGDQTIPSDWQVSGTANQQRIQTGGSWFNPTYTSYTYFTDPNGIGVSTIRIPAEKFQGKSRITVSVTARSASSGGQLALCNKYRPYSLGTSEQTYTKTIVFPPVEDYDTYRPDREGYTALLVAVYDNSGTKGRLPWANQPMDRSCKFTRKQDVVNYIKDNIQFVKLLTDGIRVGDGENIGTVFRCDGTYNKFFFLGKGQARKKDSGVLAAIGTGDPMWPDYMCEQLPFHYMFEQFSPTTPADESQIEDFYTEMMDGKLYDIVHDCPSVIQNEHQFSMSGNNGTTAYGMTGMNFYIPDYRLKYWTRNHELYNNYRQDGRDMNAYMAGADTDKTGVANNQADHIGVYFGMYNPDHAPQVGIYKITLDATVAPVAGYDSINNANYNITLDWVSSLDQMSGSHYPQHYYIYQIGMDSVGNETRKVIAEIDHDDLDDFNHYNIYKIVYDEDGNVVLDEEGNPVREKIGEGDVTTDDPTYLILPDVYPQDNYSQTFTFIIEGWPVNSDRRPSFFAWSNPDQVVIPGKSQFLSLRLDHYESDFIINGKLDLDSLNKDGKHYECDWANDITGEHNYYRNFVTVNSDEVMSGLTIDKINQGMYRFDMLRSTLIPETPGELKIARLEFERPVSAGAKEVNFTITYDDNTQYLVANKFRRNQSNMNIPESGTVRVMGNGDLVIQPNGYHVNFYSITVRRGNSTIASWNNTTTYQTDDNKPNLPNDWYLSPGSLWVQDKSGYPYYLEGGGYIAIPNVINGTQEVTVTINASGDMSTVPTILVDDRQKKIETGDAQDYTWTIPASAGQTPTLNYYKKITSVDELTDGKYLIVCENTGGNPRALNGNANTNIITSRSNSGDVTISSDYKITDTDGDLYYFNISCVDANRGIYGIQSNSGLYIGCYGDQVATGNSDLQASTAFSYASNITFDASGNAIIKAMAYNQQTISNVTLQYNEYDNNHYFRYFYNNNLTPIQLYKYVEESQGTSDYGKLRIGALPFVDQFKAETKYDEHPYRYGYQLKEVVSEGANGSNVVYGKASSMVEVPVQHTNSRVNGYYTLDEIDADTICELDTNILIADVQMNLSATNSAVFFNTIQNRTNQLPIVFKNYATILQHQTDFTYKEMKNPSDRFNNIYDPGLHHYYDSIATIMKGKYANDFKSYLPSVMTRGIDRRYYTSDTLHNTYGAPIWRTGVGKVELTSGDAVLQMARDKNGNWIESPTTNWTDSTGNTCALYIIDGLEARGWLPKKIEGKTNVDYEPYMFRIFVKSKNHKLRGFKKVTSSEGNEYLDTIANYNDSIVCVWSGYVKDLINPVENTTFEPAEGEQSIVENVQTGTDDSGETMYIYHKNMPSRGMDRAFRDKNYAVFGALTGLQEENTTDGTKIAKDELEIVVRFYYIGEGLDQGHERMNQKRLMALGQDEIPFTHPAGYPVEASGQTSPRTAVSELFYHGEVVSTTYYNLQGVASSKPFDGLNIVVVRYSDGSTIATKQLMR